MPQATKILDAEQALRMKQARVNLIKHHPWFGMTSLSLKFVEGGCERAATDGTHLFYNPSYIATQSFDESVFTVAHETLHCGLLHPYRLKGRDLKRANKAMDYVINYLLREDGFTLVKDCFIDDRFAGMSWETVYAILEHEEEQEQEKQQQEKANSQQGEQEAEAEGDSDDDEQSGDQGDDDGDADDSDDAQSSDADDSSASDDDAIDESDDVRPASTASSASADGDEAEQTMSETDWMSASEQAMMAANKRGLMPGGVERAFRDTLDPKVDWRAALRQFVENVLPSDYSWSTPNRRFAAGGLYLPGLKRENIARIAVVFDTSGSITQAMVDQFNAELTTIVREMRPSAVDVLCCDAAVQTTDTFTPDDVDDINVRLNGGGGTYFQPAFDYLNAQDEQPAAAIYLTDLGNLGETLMEPDYSVLWVTPERVTDVGQFGQTIRFTS
jgi:predicted metal-dependent peptidase